MLSDLPILHDFFPFLIIVFVLSWGGTWGIRKIAIHQSFLDIPNQRSSHTMPTPHGGGLAILFSFYLTAGWLVLTGEIQISGILGLSCCGLGIAAVGFTDDLLQLSALKRLVVHFCCVLLAVHFFIPDDALLVSGNIEIPSILLKILLVIGMVWLLNLFNFMDGIDGLAGAEGISVALGAGLILIFTGEINNYLLLLIILSTSVAGFLVWNWPPAKIFMGDGCSSFLGFFFGIIALLTSSTTALSIWTWMILLGTFIVDSTVTLGVRGWRGEKIYQAHRSHAYQIIARRVESHLKVTLYYIGINWLLLFPLAWLSVYKAESGILLVILSYSILTLFCLLVGAGTTND